MTGCWEGLGAGGEGDDRGWDGWMVSLTQWTWVWVNSGSWWWTGRPGMLQFAGSQRVRHDWATELNWTDSCLENSSDREAWQATVYRIAELDTTEVTLYAYMQDIFCLWQLCPSESWKWRWCNCLACGDRGKCAGAQTTSVAGLMVLNASIFEPLVACRSLL